MVGNNVKWGTKVYPTELSIERTINKRHEYGICVGYSNSFIRVIKLGRSTAGIFAKEFWQTEELK